MKSKGLNDMPKAVTAGIQRVRTRHSIRLLMLLAALIAPRSLEAQAIRVVTMNIWSGLNYRGTFRMGEYESDSTRDLRLRLLAQVLREAKPDIVALQECNPAGSVGSFLARNLGYDYIAQRANGGLKIGRLGIPTNLNEGLVLLAKKELRLKEIDVLDLSKTFGAFGNALSFHTSDQNIALVGAVTVDRHQILIVNTHLTANIPFDSATSKRLNELAVQRHLDDPRQRELSGQFERRGTLRKKELERLIDHYETHWLEMPVLVLGDFNAPPDAPELRMMDQYFLDAAPVRGLNDVVTWDPVNNPNIDNSRHPTDSTNIEDMMNSWYDGIPRRIDYVLLNRSFDSSDVRDVRLIATEPHEGAFISDHYGIFSEIDLGGVLNRARGQTGDVILSPPSNLDVLPILTYDTDVGFGYGGKAFFLNFLGASESFDAVAFNSTKGERWYRLVFSVPDFELRQGKPYPISFDVIVDYDKYLKNNFFGIGRHSRASDRETYTKEPLEVQIVGSRGFSAQIVGQLGVRFRTVRNVHIDPAGLFAATLPAVNQGRSQALTFLGSFRYDSRNSFVNPSSGNVVQFDGEVGSSAVLSAYDLASVTLSLQTYHVLFYPKTVFAGRVVARSAAGSGLPVHAFATLGGTGTLRGYPQDRFLDKAILLTNFEIRFPIFWRFDGVAFYDAGTLGPAVGRLDLSHGWRTNPGFGLRFIMDTFVVRADLGFSGEGTGFYFNFGHLF